MTLHPQPGQLDWCFTTAKAGDVIVLGAGTYPTKGNWAAGAERAWCQVDSVRIIGQGSERTRILLKDPVKEADGVERPDKDLNVLWARGNFELEGVHLDGDYHNQGGWYVGGLRVRDGRYTLNDVRITGLRGSWDDPATQNKQIEVFGVSSQGNTSRSYLERVRVDDVASDSYVSGIYGGGDFGCKGSICTDCSVDLGGNNQFSYACNPGWTFRDCRGEGTKYGMYNDTGPTGVSLHDCRITASYAAVSMVAKVETDFRYAKVNNCELVAPRAIELVDDSQSGILSYVLLDGCRLNGNYAAAVDGKTAAVVIANSVFVNRDMVRFRTAKSPVTVLILNRWLDGSPASISETVA
jgi:hypothetical protein